MTYNRTLEKLPAYNVTAIGRDQYLYEDRIYRSQLEIWKERQQQILYINRYKGE